MRVSGSGNLNSGLSTQFSGYELGNMYGILALLLRFVFTFMGDFWSRLNTVI